MRKHAAPVVHGCGIQRLHQLPKKHGICVAVLHFYSYQISQLDCFTHFVRFLQLPDKGQEAGSCRLLRNAAACVAGRYPARFRQVRKRPEAGGGICIFADAHCSRCTLTPVATPTNDNGLVPLQHDDDSSGLIYIFHDVDHLHLRYRPDLLNIHRQCGHSRRLLYRTPDRHREARLY